MPHSTCGIEPDVSVCYCNAQVRELSTQVCQARASIETEQTCMRQFSTVRIQVDHTCAWKPGLPSQTSTTRAKAKERRESTGASADRKSSYSCKRIGHRGGLVFLIVA